MDGKSAEKVHVAFAAPLTAAREINGQEQPLASATVQNGELVTQFTPYQPRSFAVRLGPAASHLSAPQFATVKLPYDISVASFDGKPAGGCFDCSLDRPASTPQGRALPAEMLPSKIDYAGITFALGAAGKPNAVAADGQTMNLPAGSYNRIYLLAAAADGDHSGTFRVGDQPVNLNIEEWTGFVGQWDDRIWKTAEEELPARPGTQGERRVELNEYAEMIGIRPGYIKRADIAWFASHRHDAGGANEPYAYSYLFAYALDLPQGAKTLTLPHNPNIRVLAATVVNENGKAWPAQPLYDVLAGNTQ
jgi:alpha-mannosidase